MSKPKHTPGPWMVEVGPNTTAIESKHFTIATDVSNNDADLLAAAPDLLAALKGVMELLDSGYLVRNTDDDAKPDFALRQIVPVAKLKSALDAIDKAEGKESA